VSGYKTDAAVSMSCTVCCNWTRVSVSVLLMSTDKDSVGVD